MAVSAYVALLRAVNVGGTGKLPMITLKAMCVKAGFSNVQTYIASGNVLFTSPKTEAQVKSTLEAALAKYAGKPVGVMVRTAVELEQVLAKNPFKKQSPSYTVAIFLDAPPPADALLRASGVNGEELAAGAREIYVFYANGQGRSKLKIPAASNGTARNMNTVAKLSELAAAMPRA